MAEAKEVPLETKATRMSEMDTLVENTDLETHKNKVWAKYLMLYDFSPIANFNHLNETSVVD